MISSISIGCRYISINVLLLFFNFYVFLVGIKKTDLLCEPITLAEAWQLDCLNWTSEHFKILKKPSQTYKLTPANTEANVQTFKAIVECVKYLITEKGFQKFLLASSVQIHWNRYSVDYDN